MDSAAVDTVAPPSTAPSIPIKENDISKRGIKFRAANGTPINIHGEKDLNGVNNEWSTVGMKAQVADVNKVLGSVYQMCKAGNKVIFDINEKDPNKGGYIENKSTGSRTFMEVNQVTGEFQFDLWIKKQVEAGNSDRIKVSNRFGALQSIEETQEDPSNDQGFRRQADPL